MLLGWDKKKKRRRRGREGERKEEEKKGKRRRKKRKGGGHTFGYAIATSKIVFAKKSGFMRSYILKVIDTGTAIRVTRKFYKISRKLITAFHASVELVLMPPFPLSNISIIPLTSDKTRCYIVANIRVLVAFTCGNLYRDTFVPPVSLSWSGIFIENGIFIVEEEKKSTNFNKKGGRGRDDW